jgi:hypothetical protein
MTRSGDAWVTSGDGHIGLRRREVPEPAILFAPAGNLVPAALRALLPTVTRYGFDQVDEALDDLRSLRASGSFVIGVFA